MAHKAKANKGILRRIAFVVLAVYVIFTLVDMQVTLSERTEELASLKQVQESKRILNKDLKRQLANSVDEEEIERVAREQLEFVAPNEKVFIDISGS